MTDLAAVIETHGDLLTRPLLASVATRRPDGSLQVNPMWFEWDGSVVRLSLTTTRQKLRNLESYPGVAICVVDPDRQFRYVELRGELARMEDDADRAFVRRLGSRYLDVDHIPPPTPDEHRVIAVIVPTGFSARG